MTDYIHKRHNVNMMLYHIVCPTKFRKVVVDSKVDTILKETCIQIQNRYDIHFVEIGTDLDHVHFLVQSSIIISALEKIVKAFEDTIQIDLIRQSWEEIKKLSKTINVSLVS